MEVLLEQQRVHPVGQHFEPDEDLAELAFEGQQGRQLRAGRLELAPDVREPLPGLDEPPVHLLTDVGRITRLHQAFVVDVDDPQVMVLLVGGRQALPEPFQPTVGGALLPVGHEARRPEPEVAQPYPRGQRVVDGERDEPVAHLAQDDDLLLHVGGRPEELLVQREGAVDAGQPRLDVPQPADVGGDVGGERLDEGAYPRVGAQRDQDAEHQGDPGLPPGQPGELVGIGRLAGRGQRRAQGGPPLAERLQQPGQTGQARQLAQPLADQPRGLRCHERHPDRGGGQRDLRGVTQRDVDVQIVAAPSQQGRLASRGDRAEQLEEPCGPVRGQPPQDGQRGRRRLRVVGPHPEQRDPERRLVAGPQGGPQREHARGALGRDVAEHPLLDPGRVGQRRRRGLVRPRGRPVPAPAARRATTPPGLGHPGAGLVPRGCGGWRRGRQPLRRTGADQLGDLPAEPVAEVLVEVPQAVAAPAQGRRVDPDAAVIGGKSRARGGERPVEGPAQGVGQLLRSLPQRRQVDPDPDGHVDVDRRAHVLSSPSTRRRSVFVTMWSWSTWSMTVRTSTSTGKW